MIYFIPYISGLVNVGKVELENEMTLSEDRAVAL